MAILTNKERVVIDGMFDHLQFIAGFRDDALDIKVSTLFENSALDVFQNGTLLMEDIMQLNFTGPGVTATVDGVVPGRINVAITGSGSGITGASNIGNAGYGPFLGTVSNSLTFANIAPASANILVTFDSMNNNILIGLGTVFNSNLLYDYVDINAGDGLDGGGTVVLGSATTLSVKSADATINVTGSGVSVGTIAESQVTNLVSDLASKSEALDELLENPDIYSQNTVYTPTYMSGKVTNETWTLGLNPIKTIDYTYSGDLVSVEVKKIYSGLSIIAQVTTNFFYSGDTISQITHNRDI